ncbi:hypothetical protein QQ020_26895 [Fulvivirgaceae bacterium BMA12]|uniref:Lipoprotein n=1 Tax=Agaribacillus aureus TaxID=3051825 RepID=A0ABT8LG57_9BACT|nr:hypothetical protein [Fulvivirgaceae bacterium BMA12]
MKIILRKYIKKTTGPWLLLISTIISGFVITGCDSSDGDVAPKENFVKIYNNELFDITYNPLDVKQAADGSYIILSTANETDTYLLRVDEFGEFISDTTISTPYTNPLSELFLVNGDYHFFSMDNVTLSTYLLKVNLSDSNQTPELVQSFPDIIYPLHASQVPDDGFLIQSYNRDARSTALTKLAANFNQSWQAEYEVLEDVEGSIIAKFAGTGERSLPYFTGATDDGSVYFLNGFFNFSFSLLFVNGSNGDLIGTLNGLREETGISAAVHLTGDQYALSRFSFEENFILPNGAVNIQGNDFSGEIGGNEFPEIQPEAKVVVKKLDINGTNAIVYGTETKSKQMVLYIYDATDGSLINAKYFGNTNPYEFGNFALTDDGGLAIVGRTFVAGRFPRIAFFKMSQEEVNSLIQ